MKFMVRWRIHSDQREAALKAFAQMTNDDDRRDMGNN